ncbi:MAG: phosphotransferase [Candidatus Solibacter sp.]
MIPQERTTAVTRGLREAFGVTEFEDISTITKGQTNSLVFRIVVLGTPYLLKIITRAEDPTRHYTCMRAAADAGLAPSVRYTNTEDHVSITDFAGTSPFSVSEARARLPLVLRTLHALPPFARAPFNTTSTFLLTKGPASDGFLQKFQAGNILPKNVQEELFARYAEVAAVYPYGDTEMVSSHNDLYKPDNILFDGQQVWLVDWEAAFLNDRYADLAVVANQIVTNAVEEGAYLAAYFGAPPEPYQAARFFLMQQLAHIFYTMAFLFLSGAPVDWNEAVPTFRDFQQGVWAGEIDLADPLVKLVHGRVHCEQLLQNVNQPRYREALKLVGARRAVA